MKKRLAILKQVDRILKHCHCHNTHLKQTCEHCIKLRPLGEQLLKLTKPRKNVTTSGEIVPFKEVKKEPVKPYSRPLTIDEYVQAKINKISDDEFYKQRNVTHYSFRVWKRENLNEINSLKKKLKAK